MFTIFDSGIGLASTAPVKPSKLSPSERLYRELQAHRDSQATILAKTKQAERLANTPLAGYVLQLVRDNESRQAEVMTRVAASLQDALSWSRSADALPVRGNGSERAEAIRQVQDLLALEQARAASARRLAKAYTDIGEGIEQALLESSAAVAESNAHLLKVWLRGFAERPATASTTGWQPAHRSNKAPNGRQVTASVDDETLAA